MNDKVKLIQELLINYSQSIFTMWQRIDDEIDTSINGELMPLKTRNEQVITLRDKIVSEELSDLWKSINFIIGSEISISDLIDVSKLMVWAWNDLRSIYQNLELTEQERMLIIKSIIYNQPSLIKGHALNKAFIKDEAIIKQKIKSFWDYQLRSVRDKLINYL